MGNCQYMLSCVKRSRLDRIRINERYTGARIRKEDLMAVRSAVLHAIGMEAWTHQGSETGRPIEPSRTTGPAPVPVEINTIPKK